MAAKAGKNALVKVSGSILSFTGEAFTTVAANTTYQITDTTKRVWDRSATITVKKDAATQAATLYTLNRLTGTITFNADIGGGHTITADGSYLPMSTAAQAKTYDYAITAVNADVTKFGDAYRVRIQTLKDISGSLSDWKIDTFYSTTLIAGVPIVIEFWSDSTAAFDVRCWALLDKQQVKNAVAGVIEETVSFAGQTDVDGRSISG